VLHLLGICNLGVAYYQHSYVYIHSIYNMFLNKVMLLMVVSDIETWNEFCVMEKKIFSLSPRSPHYVSIWTSYVYILKVLNLCTFHIFLIE
jgi:hypothetical protein